MPTPPLSDDLELAGGPCLESDNSTTLSLTDALYPVEPATFVARHLGRSFCHGSSIPGRYGGLMPWGVLNGILAEHRFLPPRLRLYQRGVKVDPYAFQHRQPAFALRPEEFLKRLRGGATLAIDAVEELHAPLREFAAQVHRAFRAPVNINLYAGWSHDNGFDCHFDPQENLILQVHGRKHWTVWKPAPQRPDAEGQMVEPVFDSILEEGAWLYLPQGWWHVARPLGEPCLHLTVTITPYTGRELLMWLAQQLAETKLASLPLPVLEGEPARNEYIARLAEALCQRCSPESMEMFLRERNLADSVYPRFWLPSLEWDENSAAE